jgi:hypothetical protein
MSRAISSKPTFTEETRFTTPNATEKRIRDVVLAENREALIEDLADEEHDDSGDDRHA